MKQDSREIVVHYTCGVHGVACVEQLRLLNLTYQSKEDFTSLEDLTIQVQKKYEVHEGVVWDVCLPVHYHF